MFSVAFGEQPNPSSHRQSAWQWTNTFGDRPMIDTMSALIYHNLFGRFPNVQVLSIENGSLWVAYLLKAMDKMKGMGRGGPWPGGYVKGKPSEIFKQHVYVSPYFEEDIEELAKLIGVERILFGSDFPHPEGISRPLDFKEYVSGFSESDQHKIMGGNARPLLGISE